MEKSGMFNSIGNDIRAYQATDFALPHGALAGGKGGVMMGIGTDFVPEKTGDKSISIGSGFAFLGEMPGFWYYNEESTEISESGEGTEPILTFPTSYGVTRVNLVAIKMDPITEMKAALVVLNGIEDEEYTEPTVEAMHAANGPSVYYVPIAKVIVTKTNEGIQKISEVIDIRETTVGNSSISAFGIEAGYCALQQLDDDDQGDLEEENDIARGTWVKSYYGIGISDGSRIVNQGLCNIDLRALRVYGMKKAIAEASDPVIESEEGINAIVLESQPEPEDIWPLTYYVQEDGRIDTVPTKKIAGFSLNENLLLVSIQGPFGQDKDYDGEIEGFNAMPGPDNTVRFKLKLPEGAQGVLLKYKTEPWVETDTIESGIKIEDVEAADCLNAFGDNKWYEAEIKNQDNSLYNLDAPIYVKAFPYASGYNQTIGKHEKTVSVGSLVAEWTVDSDVPNDDTAGERNLSTTGIGTEPGKVGNALVGSNGYAMMANEIDMGGNTLTFWLWPTGTDTGLFGDTTAVHVYALIESNALTFGAYNHLETYGINSGEYYFVAFTFSGDSVNLFVNGEFIKSVIASSSTYSRIIDTIGRASVGGTGTTNYRKMNCHMDQIRIFQGLLTTDDLENLYNDGAGC